MALITPSELFADIKGSIGSVTFSRSRAGLVAKKRSVGRVNYTNKQAEKLKVHQYVIRQWLKLSLSTQLLWNDYAELWAQVNRYGQTKILTGLQWFSHMNNLKYVYDGSILEEPPIRESAIPPEPFSIEITEDYLKIIFDSNFSAPNNLLYIFATLPNQLTLSRNRGKFRLIKTIDEPNLTEIDLTADYIQYFGFDWATMAQGSEFKMQICIYTVNKDSWLNSVQLCALGSNEPRVIFARVTEDEEIRITEDEEIRITEQEF